jgi:endonuclease YncB( thermonuclease family)
MRIIQTVIILALPLALFFPFYHDDWLQIQGIRAIDGDTVEYLWNGDWKKGRLKYIDAPEKDQKEGKWAINFMKKWLQSHQGIQVKFFGKDLYGRELIELKNRTENLNFLLVKNGYAIVYPFSKFNSREEKLNYKYAQLAAYQNKKGIWKKNFINPYFWRKCRKVLSKNKCDQKFQRALKTKKSPTQRVGLRMQRY